MEREPDKIPACSGSILIVEGDSSLREALELFLRADGYHTAAATNGDEAIDLVARKDARPGIVVVDYNLSRGLSGLQVVARLRHARPNVPALFLTGDISTKTLSEIAWQGYSQSSKPIGAEDPT